MILGVHLPSGLVLVDPTSRTTALGELPAGSQGTDVLPITAKGHGLMRSPVDPASSPEQPDPAVGGAPGKAPSRQRTAKSERQSLGLTARTGVPRSWLDSMPVTLARHCFDGAHFVGDQGFSRGMLISMS